MNKILQSLVIVFVVSFSLSPFLVSYAEVTEDSWATMAEMPTARSGLGVAVVNGKIYAIVSDTNYEYDPATDTWATKTPMPTPRSDFGIAVVENKIFVIGGSTGDYTYTGVNEVYDPSTDTWETKTSMPTPRKSLDANAVNGKIYMIGGFQYAPFFNEIDVNEVYDPVTDSWTTKASIPNAVQGYASAVVDNKIYVIEGFNSSLNQIYDPETDTWSFGEPSPAALSSAAAGATTGVAAPKRIYVAGGWAAWVMLASNLVRVYDPEADVWTKGTPMPTHRYSLGVAVVNDVLYAIGGSTGWIGDPIAAQNEQYTPFGYGTVSQQEPFPTWIVAAIVIVAVVGAALLVYFRKIKKTTEKAE